MDIRRVHTDQSWIQIELEGKRNIITVILETQSQDEYLLGSYEQNINHFCVFAHTYYCHI